MGHAYQAVGWNRQKKIYDGVLLGAILLYLGGFLGLGFATHPDATFETMLIRALGTGALLLLHVILSIGPLCRLDRRFLPLLYNRRHLGVAMFILALGHGTLSTIQFHAFGDLHPLVSLLVSNTRFDNLAQFPFQPLGFFALIILALMATTSHDFWLSILSAPVWKALHMLVYVAYALIVMHVVLGVLQTETSLWLSGALGAGVLWVFGLHIVAGRREVRVDLTPAGVEANSYVDVCALQDIPEKRAKVVSIDGERVAVFRYDGRVSALSNPCQHQNGPLGEGCIRDGLVTCPWHGYQYRPDSGASPEPFTEKVPTFKVKVEEGRVLVQSNPQPAGTRVEPATFNAEEIDV